MGLKWQKYLEASLNSSSFQRNNFFYFLMWSKVSIETFVSMPYRSNLARKRLPSSSGTVAWLSELWFHQTQSEISRSDEDFIQTVRNPEPFQPIPTQWYLSARFRDIWRADSDKNSMWVSGERGLYKYERNEISRQANGKVDRRFHTKDARIWIIRVHVFLWSREGKPRNEVRFGSEISWLAKYLN